MPQNAQVVERVYFTGDRLGNCAHARPAGRIARQQTRIPGPGLVEILDDRHRLGHNRPVVVDQYRHEPLRVELEEFLRKLILAPQMDEYPLRIERLEVERDAHPEGAGRAIVVV